MNKMIDVICVMPPRDESFTSCDDCIHSDDEEAICVARRCIHAIHFLKECYEPRKKRVDGHWINNQNGTFECDQCGCKHSRSKWCPNCGARMDREVTYGSRR